MMVEDPEASRTQELLRDATANEGGNAIEDQGEMEKRHRQSLMANVAGDEADYRAAHLQGARDHYYHKGNWSWFLMVATGAMILLQFALLYPVGLGWLDYTAYDWLLPVLLVQTFGQVTGLAVYAVRYLFSDISNQLPARSKGIPDDSAKRTRGSRRPGTRGSGDIDCLRTTNAVCKSFFREVFARCYIPLESRSPALANWLHSDSRVRPLRVVEWKAATPDVLTSMAIFQFLMSAFSAFQPHWGRVSHSRVY